MRTRRRALLSTAALVAAVVSATSPVGAASRGTAVTTASASSASPVPPGFVQTRIVAGLKNPSVFVFAPNGDMYIAEQVGIILVYRNGAILPTPLASIKTDSRQEMGLLGLALDPNYAANGYLYVSYTTPDSHAQLSRLTVVNGSANQSSEVVLLKGTQLQTGTASANDLHVGPDGKLWWSVGDAGPPDYTNGRTLTTINGKMLRLNLDGTIPSDNPFLNVPNAVPAIYAYGLRNPFRFTFLPDGRAMAGDPGSSYWEELDTMQPGGNYGWDLNEGNCFSCGSINPTFAYGHLPVDGAVSAVAAYSGSAFPAAYRNVVFFGDYNRRDIEALTFDPTYQTVLSQRVFSSAAGTIADLQVGPDGSLYFVSIFDGTLTRISAVGPFSPTAVAGASPAAGAAPLAVQFSSGGSVDPYGQPLTYAWDFGDGSPVSAEANPQHIYLINGRYSATLTVSDGPQSAAASVPVLVGPSPPAASITSPAEGTAYAAGNTITYSGGATDPQDGQLPPSALSWQVDFYVHGVAQPFYTSEVAHPFAGPQSGISGGSFTIPTDVSNVPGSYYRITLTATDSLGLSTVVIRDVTPSLTSWTVGSNVPGAGFFIDGTWHTSTYTAEDVVGVQHVLAGLPIEVVNAARYRLLGWSDGSAQLDRFTSAPTNPARTVTYDPVQPGIAGPWTSVDVGHPITAGTTEHSDATQTVYSEGGGTDVWGTQDQFHYVYQPLTGNGTIIARVRYQTESSPWTKAGVMIKQSVATGAPYADVLTTPDVSPNTPNINGIGCVFPATAPGAGCQAPLPPVTPVVGHGIRMQYNFNAERGVTSGSALAGFSAPNKWLKLQRSGNTFTSWYSTDGVHWLLIGSTTLAMPIGVTVGLFVTSHNAGQASSVAFDNVRLVPG